MPFKDHFQTLRVPHRATSQQIQKAYYDRLKFFHPDFFEGDPSRRAIAEAETKSLNEAYEALATPAAREGYLREWERHHNALRVPEQHAASDRLSPEVRADLAGARQHVRELEVLVEQRNRELKAANLGIRQSQDRLQSLQRSVEAYQDNTRQLESRLLERSRELQDARGRVDALQAEVRQLMHSGGDRGWVSQPRTEPEPESPRVAGKTPDAGLPRPSANGEPLIGASAESGKAPHSVDSPQRADLPSRANAGPPQTEGDTAGQQALLDEAARQIRVLRDRLRSAEAELRERASGAPGIGQEALAGAPDTLSPEQVRELWAALTERTAEVGRVREQVAELEAQVRRFQLGSARGTFGATVGPEMLGHRDGPGREDAGPDKPAGWLTRSRATVLVTVLLVALCVVAVALILLTVSFDLEAVLLGLTRLVSPGSAAADR